MQGRPSAVPGWPFDAAEAARRQAALGTVRRTVDLGGGVLLDLVRIPPGEFLMGESDGTGEDDARRPAKVASSFWIGRLEVSNAQFARFDPAHDSRLETGAFLQFSEEERGYPVNRPEQPVVRVSWRRAMEFCRWLSSRTGERFTLPTETQWEWACRAGSATALWYGDSRADFATAANLADRSLQSVDTFGWGLPSGAVPPTRPAVAAVNDGHRVSAPCGSFRPNAWGLHDMHGNAAEWTRGADAARAGAADGDRPDDPAAPGPRVLRGGSWNDRPFLATSAARRTYPSWQRVFDVGFRVVAEEPPSVAEAAR